MAQDDVVAFARIDPPLFLQLYQVRGDLDFRGAAQALVGFKSSAELMDSRRNADIPTTRPMIVEENGQKTIVLP